MLLSRRSTIQFRILIGFTPTRMQESCKMQIALMCARSWRFHFRGGRSRKNCCRLINVVIEKNEKKTRNFNFEANSANLWENCSVGLMKCLNGCIIFRSNSLWSAVPIPTIHHRRITKAPRRRHRQQVIATAGVEVRREASTAQSWGVDVTVPHDRPLLGWLTARPSIPSRRRTASSDWWSWFWSRAKWFNSN